MKFIALKLCRSGGSPSIFKGIEAHSFRSSVEVIEVILEEEGWRGTARAVFLSSLHATEAYGEVIE